MSPQGIEQTKSQMNVSVYKFELKKCVNYSYFPCKELPVHNLKSEDLDILFCLAKTAFRKFYLVQSRSKSLQRRLNARRRRWLLAALVA